MEDSELVARLREGDEEAFRFLVTRYFAPMKRLASSFVSGGHTAEDVVQDTFMAVLRGLPRFEGRSSLKTWMFRILVNRAKTRGVRDARAVPFSALARDNEDIPAVDPSRFDPKGLWKIPPRRWDDDTPERLALLVESRELVEGIIETLPERQRAVITLRDVQGWSSQEVCELLEISEANQRVLLHRARSRVRGELASYLEKTTGEEER